MQEDCDRDDHRRREHERARDDERRAGVEAVVAAHADGEKRRQCREREEDAEGVHSSVVGACAVVAATTVAAIAVKATATP